jgi:DNA-binding beta-propeller fold protein YncE
MARALGELLSGGKESVSPQAIAGEVHVRRLCLFVSLALAACSSSSVPSSGGLPASSPNTASKNAASAGQYLYVSNYSSNTVAVYKPMSSVLERTISAGLSGPVALVIDKHGTLYVVNQVGGTVTIYGAGKSKPRLTISGLSQPYAITVDLSGNLYVATASALFKYGPGKKKPTYSIMTTTAAAAIAVDSKHRTLYAAFPSPSYICNGGGSGGTVTAYNGGSGAVIRTITNGISNPIVLALGTRGMLYVANRTGGSGLGSIGGYEYGRNKPQVTIVSGISCAFDIVAMRSGALLAGNDITNSGTITRYPPGSTTPVLPSTAVYQNGQPRALAADKRGDLAVGSLGYGSGASWSVSLYAPGAKAPSLSWNVPGSLVPNSLAFADK